MNIPMALGIQQTILSNADDTLVGGTGWLRSDVTPNWISSKHVSYL